ncbi:MAG TPA: pyruvate dehydrogenase (acetyl-transferring), homodimeric type [Candidatus Latescibacteria bacterium]|nr:pyruvate dehydrogenase (acetyl-transferring), homodimeric type [Candidatus Latescibacterota bacterium]HOS64055.1 pyruvate dehydrogenase (acetyl-transferring), homodimeric type [Candidatus Latescibacterota bacterium]HPK74910.1 pyruvate dehydrogenase (acetyl-transferring), homodimeric type [Candidatus Latescibacterota bacterium]
MSETTRSGESAGMNLAEKREWLDSLYYVLRSGGPERVEGLLQMLQDEARIAGVDVPFSASTPHINTIPPEKQPPYPGSREIERRIKSLVRWNAMAMVVRANRASSSIGGHISTYASAATLYEVGFNHFFRGRGDGYDGDQIYFQGHASPGIYARAFLEGRLTEEDLESFRQELRPGGGLSSYPHPWLMPEFWEFPTVSMGLGPIMSIYQARFNRYLEDRGLKKDTGGKVWAFLGDGETDEPESLGAITLAAREKLDNLIWVINCNLQRLDGPVRGNGHIIEELEAAFRGAGWNVIKVVWGSEWDELIAADRDGILVRRMGEVVDGEYQKYSVEGGAYIRKHFFGADPRLLKMVENYSDEHLQKMRLGGHDPEKVYAAFKAAVEHKGHPTVVLARTIKGYGLGEAGEGKNVAHQQKKMNEKELSEFRSRFGIPISDEDLATAPFYRPPDGSREIEYMLERRRALGGFAPSRKPRNAPLPPPDEDLFAEFARGTEDRGVSTTMVFVRLLTKLLRDPEWGKLVVPIVPDEARTFGMEALFRQSGIYSHVGQLYDPVDRDNLLYYKEARDGQILEEGITEAGSMASFIAAGTAYATHGVNTIPFFIFYSMFGLQRVGDLVWAAGDIRARGFLIGGTAGRTTLAGEGLQHQDGNSHLLAYPVPNLIAYDPAFAFELAVIIRDGMRRMYKEQESVFYYVTVENENYPMPAMPAHVDPAAILKGMYKFRPASLPASEAKANLFGSGTILNEALKAQHLLEDVYNVPTDVWSITSYKELYRDGLAAERWNVLHPFDPPKEPYVASALKQESGAFVMASDYVKALPASIDRWFPTPPVCLGTDGFGRSDGRRALRRFFEVNAEHITLSALTELTRQGKFAPDDLKKAMRDLLVNPDKPNPAIS